MESPTGDVDDFSIGDLKRFGMNPTQASKRNTSSTQYLESGPTSCPTTKHVLYVEVVPSRCFKIENESDDDYDVSEDEEDPLMMNSSPSSPPKKKKKKKKDKRKNVNLRLGNMKYELQEIKRERSISPDSLPSPSRPYSPVWSPESKPPKRKSSRKHHTREIFKCNRSNCSYTSEDVNDLNDHKKLEHKGKKDFQCDQCIYRGSTASDLRKHYRQHTGEIPFVCTFKGCNYKAKHNNSLVYHTKKYHPTGPPIKCDASSTCVFTTYLKAALRHHKMMAHGGGKTLACEHCPYKCYLMADLRKHHRVHTGENPYHCDFEGCHYACKISSNLKKHKRIHTEEKPYACDVCDFRTNFINSLKVHKRTHTNERPYCCDQCGYRCNHTSNLKKHVARLHPGAVYTIVKMPPINAPMEMQTAENPQL